MKSQFAARVSTVAIAIGTLLLASACAATQPPAAASATASPIRAVGAQPVSGSSVPENRGTIAISDQVRKACGIADEDAYFAFDSSSILTTDIAPLDAVAKCFTVGPLKGRDLRLVGHADPRGTLDYNMTLGQFRADSVEKYLDHHGLGRSKIGTTSRGALDATGQNEAGWSHDRRVDVMLGG